MDEESTQLLGFIAGIKTLLGGLVLLGFVVYVSLKSPEQLQQHRRLRKLKDRHIAEYFAGGIAFIAFSMMMMIKQWPGRSDDVSELENGLILGLLSVTILAMAAVVVTKVLSRLRD